MTKYYCDRCKKDVQTSSALDRILVKFTGNVEGYLLPAFELCAACLPLFKLNIEQFLAAVPYEIKTD